MRFAGLVALPFAPSDCSALLVSVEVLAALDALLWLRTGDRAAAHLQCIQSTVSRHSRRCLQVFGLHMEKRAGEWCLRGDQTLIDLERSVHQLLRWRQGVVCAWTASTGAAIGWPPRPPPLGRLATSTTWNTSDRRSCCAGG